MDFFFRCFFHFSGRCFLHLHPCRCYRSSPTVDADPGYAQRTLEITRKQLVSTHELPQYHYQGMKRDGSRQKFSGTLNVWFPLHMGASENNGTPKWMVKICENNGKPY